MAWKDYWDSRWQWSAAGSIHSQYPEDEAYIIRSDPALKNKFITIANMPSVKIAHFANRAPQIEAWASTKYEWGKQRAIYGTDLTSYTLAHFAFYNCEDVLPRQFPVGRDANDSNVTNRVAGILRSKLPFCLDFEDFNSQHSASSMRAVINAYLSVFGQRLTEEQQTAALWTAESIGQQRINDNVGLKETYTARGTLLSGWRLTTFMNSVLNYIYTQMIMAEKGNPSAGLHNGDDVLIGVNNLGAVQTAAKNSRKYNVRMQPAKCAFGAIAEFLRIDHKRGSKGQYLSRAVATLVHSRIESRISTDARDLINSMEMRFGDCKARGMPPVLINALRDVYYTRQALICGNTFEELHAIKQTHRVCGGISGAFDADLEYIVEPGELDSKQVELPVLQGVVDYAAQLVRVLQLPIVNKKMEERLYKATLEAVVVKNRKMKLVKRGNDEWYVRVRNI
jgi:hypothetical protein